VKFVFSYKCEIWMWADHNTPTSFIWSIFCVKN